MKTYTEEDNRRYTRWMKESLKGVWFASRLPAMEIWAQDKVKEGILKPLSSLVPNKEKTIGWYVPLEWTVEDLPKYFSYWAINEFGVFQLNLDYQI